MSGKETVRAFENKELDILLVHKQLQKGNHFPNVTLVGNYLGKILINFSLL